MFIIILLFSFVTLNASEASVTSVEGFLEITGELLKGNYGYRATTELPLDECPQDLLEIDLPDGKGGWRIQLVYDTEHILMESYGVFNPPLKEENSKGIAMHRLVGGTRTVGACTIDGKARFCFKQQPEAPGIEMAARQFFEMFMADGEDVPIPRSATIGINGQVFLVSEFIEGVPLGKFLDLIKDDDPCRFFDELSFQRLVLFCMIANPEDCRLENCLVRQKSNGSYEIVLIDNERSFGREVVQSGVKTRVHCVPFCFYSMLNRPTVLKNTLCGTMVNSAKLQERLFKLLNEQKYQKALRENLPNGGMPSILGLPLGEPFISNLAGKWSKITRKIIFEGKNLADIFREVMPLQLVDLYLTDDKPGQTVLDMIMEVDAGRNGKGGTPPSAWVSLPDYFFSKEPPTADRLSGMFSEILQEYAWQFTPKTIEEMFSLAACLAEYHQAIGHG